MFEDTLNTLKTIGKKRLPPTMLSAIRNLRGSSSDSLIELVDESLPPLTQDLLQFEQIFKAPVFSDEYVAAVKLIAPQFPFKSDEASRHYWQAEQNAVCWGEWEAVKRFFKHSTPPKRILEVGPGMGRSMVFFSKASGWNPEEIHAYESTGLDTKYTILGPRYNDSFCGNIPLLEETLKFNNITNAKVFDAREAKDDLTKLPGSYDLIYSFYAIGFHWSLEHWLSDILSLMHENSIALFTVPAHFLTFDALMKREFVITNIKRAWPADSHLLLLAISKGRPLI